MTPRDEEAALPGATAAFRLGRSRCDTGRIWADRTPSCCTSSTAPAGATFNFSRNLWLDGDVAVNLLNNYDKFKYDAPSKLPRVRTDLREYLTRSDVTMPDFQLTGTRRLGQDLYGLAYAGMLESMFGGVGGEVLYRPFGERWAMGADINWVKQRGFDQDFSFRRYHVVTGQVTGYFDTGFHDVTVAVSVGRYLAGDWGSTFDVVARISQRRADGRLRHHHQQIRRQRLWRGQLRQGHLHVDSVRSDAAPVDSAAPRCVAAADARRRCPLSKLYTLYT